MHVQAEHKDPWEAENIQSMFNLEKDSSKQWMPLVSINDR